MRVLTTWMYFDEIKGEPPFRRRGRRTDADKGVGIAWFCGDTTSLREVSDLDHFQRLPLAPSHLSQDDLRNYVDLFVMDAEEFEFDRPERSLKNESTVEFVLAEPFVIERSPPTLLSLKGALTSTNLPIWIGTYMGWSVAPEHSVLLFITVPGGIIVVSSAAGLANAMGAGLNKAVKRLFRTR